MRWAPLNDESAAALESEAEAFRQAFGRDPIPGDPIFFQSLVQSEREIEEHLVEVMRLAGVCPSKIYAFRQTGRILTEENSSVLPQVEIDEWEAAIDEYWAWVERGREPERDGCGRPLIRQGQFLDLIQGELARAVLIAARIVHIGGETPSLDAGSFSDPSAIGEYVFFCLARAVQALKAVDALVARGLAVDAASSVRTMFECYVQMRFVLSRPAAIASLVEARVGLEVGTHQHLRRRDGGVDTRWVVRMSDGERIKDDYSVRSMVRSFGDRNDEAICESLYRGLSLRVHPDIRAAKSLRLEDRLAATIRSDCEAEILLAESIAALVLEQCYRSVSDDQLEIRGDITRLLVVSLPALVAYVQMAEGQRGALPEGFPLELLHRIRAIAIPEVGALVERLYANDPGGR